jgi:preprotein translocase subunit SecA
VLNIQRQSVYARRRALLTGDNADIEAELETLIAADESLKQTIEKKKAEFGEHFYPAVRRFFLQTVDYLWVDHLEAMEYLRSSVNLRAYGQRDPLVEYKKESLQLFQTMEETYIQRASDMIRQMNVSPAPAQESGAMTQGSAVQKAAMSITASSQGNAGKREYGRNDHVTITNGKETRQMKYKKAETLLESGEWNIIEGSEGSSSHLETRMG